MVGLRAQAAPAHRLGCGFPWPAPMSLADKPCWHRPPRRYVHDHSERDQPLIEGPGILQVRRSPAIGALRCVTNRPRRRQHDTPRGEGRQRHRPRRILLRPSAPAPPASRRRSPAHPPRGQHRSPDPRPTLTRRRRWRCPERPPPRPPGLRRHHPRRRRRLPSRRRGVGAGGRLCPRRRPVGGGRERWPCAAIPVSALVLAAPGRHRTRSSRFSARKASDRRRRAKPRRSPC
mmetsp:Transcript_58257/g.169103  ORF Transcript_58257/g.169103 Transcript_58257/m.169103 type:complete len:232 (-) Transcript_58257:137-832(-)